MLVMDNRKQYLMRGSDRIPVNKGIWYFDKNSQYFANLLDCSSDGMFVETRVSFPLDPIIEIVIYTDKEFIKVPAQIVRLVKKDGVYTGMGLRVLSNSEKYIQFLIKNVFRDAPIQTGASTCINSEDRYGQQLQVKEVHNYVRRKREKNSKQKS